MMAIWIYSEWPFVIFQAIQLIYKILLFARSLHSLKSSKYARLGKMFCLNPSLRA